VEVVVEVVPDEVVALEAVVEKEANGSTLLMLQLLDKRYT
jgi:hypothetical protein